MNYSCFSDSAFSNAEFGINGFQLKDRPQLVAVKRTMIKGISIFQLNEENLALIAEVFEEALALDKNA